MFKKLIDWLKGFFGHGEIPQEAETNPVPDDAVIDRPDLANTYKPVFQKPKTKYEKVWERAQKDKDQVEIPGNKDNPVILAWFKYTDYTPEHGHQMHDEVANCSAAANCWVVEGTGEKGTNSAGASSWDHWGVRLDEPVQGCVACVEHLDSNGKKNGRRHVALYDRDSSDGVSVYLYGANQGNRTWSRKYDKREVNQYRGFAK